MKRLLVLGALSTAPVLIACGGGKPGGAERVATTHQALTSPTLPVPCTQTTSANGQVVGASTWGMNNTKVQLAVADAWAACELPFPLNGPSQTPAINLDNYLVLVQAGMISAVSTWCAAQYPDPQESSQLDACNAELFYSWDLMRKDPTASCDPDSLAPVAGIDIQAGAQTPNVPTPLSASVDADAGVAPQTPEVIEAVNQDLLTAPVNLCIGALLRSQSPGASGPAALLFSDADQRELLEVIRERAQIATLQYALLGTAFAAQMPATAPEGLTVFARLPLIHQWALDPSLGAGAIAGMGNDFASAIQLHSFAIEEFGNLLSRSSSVGSPTSDTPPTLPADGVWGPGSWKQRLLALMYGGDPLAMAKNGPWTSPDEYVGPTTGAAWLDGTQLPYVTGAIVEPQVWQFLQQARRFDAVTLYPQAGGPCGAVDCNQTSNQMWQLVEANLEVVDGVVPSLPPLGNLPMGATSELWKDFQITPSHALSLASYLADAVGSCPTGSSNLGLSGAMDVVSGTAPALTSVSAGVHVAPDAAIVSRTLAEIAPIFTRNSPYNLIDVAEMIDPTADVSGLGFGTFSVSPGSQQAAEAKRTYGAISTDAAVLQMLATVPATNATPSYFTNAAQMIGALQGVVGKTTAALRPQLTGGVDANGPAYVVSTNEAGVPLWEVSVVHDPSDPFWAACTGTGCSTTISVARVDAPLAGNLARDQGTTLFGQNIAAALSLASSAGETVTGTDTPGANGMPSVWRASGLPMPGISGGTSTPAFTLLLARADSTPSYTPPQLFTTTYTYKLLASAVVVASPGTTLQGQYFATEGSMGAWTASQYELNPKNPSEPLYDGFGQLTHWVPPLNASLVGGTADQSSADYYMSLAMNAAQQATEAVQTAMSDLLQETQDSQALQAAVANSASEIHSEYATLCGSMNPSCDTSLQHTTPQNGWYPQLPDCTPEEGSQSPTDYAKCVNQHEAHAQLSGLLGTTFSIATPVLNAMANPAAPSFDDYSGGTLQSAFIAQWTALSAPTDKLNSLQATVLAANAQIDAEVAVQNEMNEQQQYDCTVGLALGVEAGMSAGFAELSFNPATMVQAMNTCAHDVMMASEEASKVALATANAFSAVSSACMGFTDAQSAIVSSSANIEALVNQAGLAQGRDQLQVATTQATLQTSFGIFQMYRDSDVWRAKALLDNARMYALAARRAIEALYVVDLSTLTQAEAFVASPATWADSIYTYDLSMPTAVGLDTSPGASPSGAVYANQVQDYVGNLQAFVAGYAVTRPAAVDSGELDIVALPGLQAGQNSDGSVDITTIGQWNYHCPVSGTWGPLPAGQLPDTACTDANGNPSKPDTIRLQFNLDPWARLNGDFANPPDTYRFNGRWTQMALNFVGTGVKDCTQAADPQGCYSEEWIPYNLTHVGPAWVTDYNEIGTSWRSPAASSRVPRGSPRNSGSIRCKTAGRRRISAPSLAPSSRYGRWEEPTFSRFPSRPRWSSATSSACRSWSGRPTG